MFDRQATLKAAAIALVLAWPGGLFATKPCPSSPRDPHSGEFDPAKCEQITAWIAVGAISRVVHHREGPPLVKDFAEFTFRVERWEKGTGKTGQTFRFKVGWCDNQQELPKDTTGPFRFVGAAPSPENQPRYLFFERFDARVP